MEKMTELEKILRVNLELDEQNKESEEVLREIVGIKLMHKFLIIKKVSTKVSSIILDYVGNEAVNITMREKMFKDNLQIKENVNNFLIVLDELRRHNVVEIINIINSFDPKLEGTEGNKQNFEKHFLKTN